KMKNMAFIFVVVQNHLIIRDRSALAPTALASKQRKCVYLVYTRESLSKRHRANEITAWCERIKIGIRIPRMLAYQTQYRITHQFHKPPQGRSYAVTETSPHGPDGFHAAPGIAH